MKPGWAPLLKRRTLWGYLLSIATAEFTRGALFISLLPAELPQRGVAAASVGLIVSAQYCADLVLKIPSGWLVDRFGSWRVLLPALAVSAVAVYLLPHTRGVGTLVALAALFGAGISPNWPAVMTGAPRLAGPESRASVMGLVFMAWLMGGGMGPVLINFLPGRDYGPAFRLLAVVITVAPLVALAGVLGLFEAAAPTDEVTRPYRVSVRVVLDQLREIRWLLPGMFTQTLALGIILPVLAPFARFTLGLSQAQYGLLLLLGGGVTVLCLLPFGRLADAYGFRPFLVAGFLLAGGSGMVLAGGAGRAILPWDTALLGLSYAMILPAWNGLTLTAVPDERQRGLFMALFMAVEGLGLAIGPVIGGLLWSATASHRMPFLVMSCMLLLMGVVYVLMPVDRLVKG